MAELTGRVIELATEQLATLRDAGHSLRVSINLSAKDLEDEALADRIGVPDRHAAARRPAARLA